MMSVLYSGTTTIPKYGNHSCMDCHCINKVGENLVFLLYQFGDIENKTFLNDFTFRRWRDFWHINDSYGYLRLDKRKVNDY